MEKFVTETLNYSMQLHGLPAAHTQLSCEGTAAISLSAAIHTNALTSLMFRIHNHYLTTIDGQGQPLEYRKQIDQRNLTQDLSIRYDHTRQSAATAEAKQWAITPGSLNLFALLYRLRCTNWQTGAKVAFDLDIESQAWRAVCVSSRVDGRTIAGMAAEEMIDITFEAAGAVQPRPWKTDLLTNRITRSGRLLVLLGPAPDRLPLLLQFGEGANRVEMKLTRHKRG